MKYDDLEKTKDLFDIVVDDVPTPIDNIDEEGISKDNLTDELTFGLSGEDAVEPQKEEKIEMLETDKKDEKKKKEKKPKRSLKEIWKSWSKKKRIMVIVSLIIIILAIVALVLFLALKDNKEEEKKPEVPEVIVEKDNYIYRDGTLVFLDQNDKEIGSYDCKNKSEEMCFVSPYSNEDNFDGEKNVYEDETLIERPSAIYQDNYVFIFDNESLDDESVLLYNIENKEIEETYSLVKGFNDSDFVIVKNDKNKYGALSFSNEGIKEVLAFSYDYLGRMASDSNLVVKTNNRYYIYSEEGKNLSQGLNYEVKSYNDQYIVVDNSGYYLYDYDGNLIYDDGYDFIELLDDYAVVIDRNKLYIRDYKNNKYNEEGIDLENSYFNPLNVYSEDKKLIETKRAYEVEINDDVLDVTLTKDGKEKAESIDLQDGKMSANYTYINYFDGVLYFYKDEEETDLLGSYSCTNKNSTDLTNCTVATDSFFSKNEVEVDQSSNVGWIPIYNERYVFILDTIDTNNPTIVLYDLKEKDEKKAKLATYTAIDSGSYTKEKKINFKSTDATYVMAKNKSGKYGLIRIGDHVSGTIAFSYTSIEKLGDYYEVGTSSNTYQLFSNVGGEITDAYGYRIVDYVGTYLKVIDGSKYYVYDFLGNKLREEDGAYNYVDLQNNYYVVIDSKNMLNIHKYSDPSFSLSESIDVGTENYNGSYTVKEVNGGFSVTITSTNTTYTFDSNGLKSVSS
mgnify:FL=1